MGEALKEISRDLDARHALATELLLAMQAALKVYEKREIPAEARRSWLGGHKDPRDSDRHINIPRCSKEHLGLIVKELAEYVAELHRVRCELPRLLKNEEEHD